MQTERVQTRPPARAAGEAMQKIVKVLSYLEEHPTATLRTTCARYGLAYERFLRTKKSTLSTLGTLGVIYAEVLKERKYRGRKALCIDRGCIRAILGDYATYGGDIKASCGRWGLSYYQFRKNLTWRERQKYHKLAKQHMRYNKLAKRFTTKLAKPTKPTES